MVAGNNNSVWLIELYHGFITIIHVKQLEEYVICSKVSISNSNNRYHLLSIYNVTVSFQSALHKSSQQFARSHEAL